MANSRYPSIKVLLEVLSIQGLTEEERRGITLLDNEESDRVGFAWRGTKFAKAMEGIEETLLLKGIGTRFSKIETDKGIIYVKSVE